MDYICRKMGDIYHGFHLPGLYTIGSMGIGSVISINNNGITVNGRRLDLPESHGPLRISMNNGAIEVNGKPLKIPSSFKDGGYQTQIGGSMNVTFGNGNAAMPPEFHQGMRQLAEGMRQLEQSMQQGMLGFGQGMRQFAQVMNEPEQGIRVAARGARPPLREVNARQATRQKREDTARQATRRQRNAARAAEREATRKATREAAREAGTEVTGVQPNAEGVHCTAVQPTPPRSTAKGSAEGDLPDQLAQEAEGDATITCPICFNAKKNTEGRFVATVCGHIFCTQCIEDVMARKGQQRCPTCRTKLVKRENRRLFF